MLVSYVGKRFGLEYNYNLMKCWVYCCQTLKKVHRNASSVMFLGSLQVSGLPTSYLLSQVTLPELLFQPAILR